MNITKRLRRRKLASGEIVNQIRYVLSFRDPSTGARRQLFFDKLRDAERARSTAMEAPRETKTLTIAEVVAGWLEAKRSTVRPITFDCYEFRCGFILPPLGRIRVNELTSKRIRQWHSSVVSETSAYAANRALMTLRAVLAFAAEEHSIRIPTVPDCSQRRDVPVKAVLTPGQVAVVITNTHERAIYAAFPFLTGVRPSEMLGLLWSDVDFGRGLIHIRRVQTRLGETTETTKTVSGRRSVPMTPLLRRMLLDWRTRVPLDAGTTYRVFPAAEGGPLLYSNFRSRFWQPTLERLGLPYVTPHSARHSFISTLQAEGVPVGTVAKIAGHKSAAVTLSFYTKAMTDEAEAVNRLDRAFGGGDGTTVEPRSAEMPL